MKLVIVRHAETKENVADVYQGHGPGILTERGKLQAKRLALRLKRKKFNAIFSSDLKRAVDTTHEITKYHKLPVHYSKLLRERNVGIYEGKTREEVRMIIEESGFDRFHFKPEKGESIKGLNARIKKFLQKIKNKYKKKTLLIVTHGGAVRAFVQLCLGIPFEEAVRFKPKNTDVITIDVDKGTIIKGS